MVLELDAGALRKVRRGAGPRDQIGQPRDVIGLDVRIEDRGDRRALDLGERDVVVDELDVRVDDGERAVRLAPEQIGGARALVVEQLPEVHALTSYQAIY